MPLNPPRTTQHDGAITEIFNPHAAPPLLTDLTLHLSAGWTFHKSQKSVGAHARTVISRSSSGLRDHVVGF
jgi:hypothetical protein